MNETIEQQQLTEMIKRYEFRVHNNTFVRNSYYKSPYEERKELITKTQELKQKLTK